MTPAPPHYQPPSDPKLTVFFGIPLKARRTARQWHQTVRDFNRTLASIYNQTNPNFRILVGCHDVPDLMFQADERLEFIRVATKPPNLAKNRYLFFGDRTHKLRAIGRRFHESGGRWLMVLDADDLVSSRIVEFVLANPNPVGYIVRQGFLLDQETRAMARVPHPKVFSLPFDQICGSSAILRFDPQSYSEGDQEYETCRFARYAGRLDHRKLWRMALEEGHPVTPLPFPGVAYVVNTGDNHSIEHAVGANWRKERLIPALRENAIELDDTLRDEFALRHPVWTESPPTHQPARAPVPNGFRVDFVGCGAVKSGTSALAHYIKMHPQIGTGNRKELHYFDMDVNFPPQGPDYDFYHNQFLRKPEFRLYGEVTPGYMYFPQAIERIHSYNPRIKLLAILRNPIERAFSHFQMEVRLGRETRSFAEALGREPQDQRLTAPRRNRRSSYIDRGFYTEQIRHIWRLFPPEQTLFIKSEDLRDDAQTVMTAVFAFLGVDPIQLPNKGLINEGGYDDEPAPNEREFLIRTFEYEIRSLERMLGWDCSSWLP